MDYSQHGDPETRWDALEGSNRDGQMSRKSPVEGGALARIKNMLSFPRSHKPHFSGQIIATSHDLTPNGGLVREIPLIQGNLGSPGPK